MVRRVTHPSLQDRQFGVQLHREAPDDGAWLRLQLDFEISFGVGRVEGEAELVSGEACVLDWLGELDPQHVGVRLDEERGDAERTHEVAQVRR